MNKRAHDLPEHLTGGGLWTACSTPPTSANAVKAELEHWNLRLCCDAPVCPPRDPVYAQSHTKLKYYVNEALLITLFHYVQVKTSICGHPSSPYSCGV